MNVMQTTTQGALPVGLTGDTRGEAKGNPKGNLGGALKATPAGLSSSLLPSSALLNAIEIRRFRIIALLLVLAITLPYGWAWMTAPQDGVYGGLLYNADDQNVHLAWARQARDGHFFFRDLFTTESLITGERPWFTNLYCTAIGLISGITTLPLVVVYHILRVVFAVGLLWAFYNLCALWTSDRRVRYLALVLVAFSSGAGYLLPGAQDIHFLDRPDRNFMVPEGWTFHSVFIYSLFSVSLALLCLTIWQTRKAQETGQTRHLVYAGLSAFLLSNLHTYDIIPLGLILLLWTAQSTTEFNRGYCLRFAPFITGLCSLPPLLYQLVVFRNSTEFQVKALTVTAPPHPAQLLSSYLLLFALAIWGGILFRRKNGLQGNNWVPFAWVLFILLCIYMPVSFARKMIEGLHLPLCFLAAVGLGSLLSKISNAQARRLVGGAAIALLSTSSLMFVGWCLNNAANNNQERAHVHNPPLYIPRDDWAALRALDASPDGRDGAVLSLVFLGNYIPRETGRIAFFSHWAETLHFGRKVGEVSRFYGSGTAMTSDEAATWLRENRIKFVVMGVYENASQAKLPLDLPLWGEYGQTRVYQVP
jgi:hypothetical protein